MDDFLTWLSLLEHNFPVAVKVLGCFALCAVAFTFFRFLDWMEALV